MGKSAKRKNRLIGFLLFVFAAMIALWCFVVFWLNPKILFVAEVETKAKTALIVNEAVMSAACNPALANLLKIERDNDGNITLLTLDYALLNTLQLEIVKNVQIALNKKEARSFDVPIGTLSGISVFSGKGANLNVLLIPAGNVRNEFFSEFVSAGINQTRFRIYASVCSDIAVVLAGGNKSFFHRTDIVICDSIIIGKVPDFYFGYNGSGLLNLVP